MGDELGGVGGPLKRSGREGELRREVLQDELLDALVAEVEEQGHVNDLVHGLSRLGPQAVNDHAPDRLVSQLLTELASRGLAVDERVLLFFSHQRLLVQNEAFATISKDHSGLGVLVFCTVVEQVE